MTCMPLKSITYTPLSHFFVFKALKGPLQIFYQNFDFWILCNLYVITCNYFKRTVKGQFIAKEEFRFWVHDQHLLQFIQVLNQFRDPRMELDFSPDPSVWWGMWIPESVTSIKSRPSQIAQVAIVAPSRRFSFPIAEDDDLVDDQDEIKLYKL